MALQWNLIFAYIAEVLEWSLKLFGLGSMHFLGRVQELHQTLREHTVRYTLPLSEHKCGRLW